MKQLTVFHASDIMNKLNTQEIAKLLGTIPKWKYKTSTGGESIYRKFEFRSFETSWAFLTRVAMKSHKMGHHPRIINEYNIVEIELTTHDVKGLSELDFKMAKSLDKATE